MSGAIVNIVTRSGSDEFRGDAFEFLRNDALRRAELLRVHLQRSASVQAQPVWRIGWRADPPRTAVLLHVLRRRPASAGRRREQPRPQRRGARLRHRSDHSTVDSVDSARQLLRCGWDAPIRRLGSGRRRCQSRNARSPVQPRQARSAARLPRPPAGRGARAGLARQQHPGVRSGLSAVHQHDDGHRNAHVWIGAAQRSAIRPQPPARRHVSGARAQSSGVRHRQRGRRARSGCRR